MTEAESVKLIQFSHPGDTIHIYPIADVHLGSVFCSERELRQTVELIKNDLNGYVMIMGDMLDMVTRTSIGDIWSQNMTPRQQIARAVEILKPVADRIIAGTEGNHEERAYKDAQGQPIEEILYRVLDDGKRVREIYAPCAGLLDVRLDLPSSSAHMTTYFKHGSGGGRTMGAKANRLMEMRNDVLADVYLVAHTHQAMAFPSAIRVPRLNSGRLYLEEFRHLHVNCNTLLGWGGYAVKLGFSPGIIGCEPIRMTAKRTAQGVEKHASVRIST